MLTEFGCQASNCKRKHCPLGKRGHKYFSGVQSCCVSSDVTAVQIGRQLEKCWLSFGWYEKAEVGYSSWGGRVNTDWCYSCAYRPGMMCHGRMCIGRSNSSFVEDLVLVYFGVCENVMNGMKM